MNRVLRVAGAISLLTLFFASVAKAKAPGLYGTVTQWNYNNDDVSGEVGHRISVNGPRARCEPDHQWSGKAEMLSGSLPPGITFDESTFGIGGIPQERGHWIVKLRLSNITCAGYTYSKLTFTQELRFHITGVGRVRSE